MDTQFLLVQYGVTEQVAPKTHVKGAASVWTELQECPRQVLTCPFFRMHNKGVHTRLHACACTISGCSLVLCTGWLGLKPPTLPLASFSAQGSTGLENDRRTDGQTTHRGQALAWA